MTELDALIAGAAGGSVAALCVAVICFGQIKNLYDQKIMYLRMQIIGLQAQIGIVSND